MMEGGIFHDLVSDRCTATAGLGAGQKTKRGKSVGVGGTQKKSLADITNMQQQQQQQQRCTKLINQQEKQQSASLAEADISIDQLLIENPKLMKLLANRNAITESYKSELETSQSNFQKLRKQNAELALTNSKMLAELNSSRQRLRELKLEIASKNGILKAMKLELAAKESRDILVNETNANESKQSDQSFQEDNKGENLHHAKRKRVSKHQSSAPAVVKQVKSTVKADNQRYSLRRESAGSKAEKLGPTEDNFEVDEIKHDVPHLLENLTVENGQTSLGSKEAREDTPSSVTTNSEQVQGKTNIEKKRQSMRRQSTRFKPENPQPTEDSFQIDDAKFVVSHLCDNMLEKSAPTTSGSGQDNNGSTLGHETNANEVGVSQSNQSDQSFQEDNKGGNLHHAKRKRVSKPQSSAPAVVKQVKSTVKVNNKKYALRRESTVSKSEKLDNFEVDQIKHDVSHLLENLTVENGRISLGSKDHEEARENAPASVITNPEQVHGKTNIEKKRQSMKKQSTRFKPENPQPTEDSFQIDDAKFAVSHLCDNMLEKGAPTTSGSGQDNNASSTQDPWQHRRPSVGRPLRRTVEQVASYKEVPLNVKMRRPN